ncbi:MAG: hypothetical protein NZ841_04650 [Dictyoglomus sp.]|nr:hypothetical protein [Dictyoglomus sp.]MDW8188566.1 hypothetical protein [Dictyoglomus sp.]
MRCFKFLLVFFLLLSIFTITGCSSFTLKVTWRKIHGYSKNELVNSCIETRDGSYLFAGMSNSKNPNGEDDFYLLKIDKWGNVLGEWFHYGERDDNAQCVIETSDGGILVLGESYSYATGISKDLYVVKLDKKGNIVWAKNFGGVDMDGGRSAIEDSDGNYILVGWTRSFGAGNSDFYMIKLSPNGEQLWSKTWGGRNFDEANCILESEDGNYLIAGYTLSFGGGGKDIALIKIDKNGNLVWYRTYGGARDDSASAIIKTIDGNYLLVGSTFSYGSKGDIYVLKVNSAGNIIWERNFGGEESEEGVCVVNTKDGGFVIVGSTRSYGVMGLGVYILKISSSGEPLWYKVYDGEGDDEGRTVLELEDGSLLVGGLTRSWGAQASDVLILKLNFKGEL